MANLEQQLLALEEGFWGGDADYYRQNLTRDSLMTFAEPVGVLTTNETISSIASSQRWADFRFDEVRVIQPAENVAILSYRAVARREDDASDYSALASSVYIRDGDSWKMAFHQQTPTG